MGELTYLHISARVAVPGNYFTIVLYGKTSKVSKSPIT